MEFVELFGVLQDFGHKFTVALSLSRLLAAAHRVLKAIECPGFTLLLRKRLSAAIELSIDQLPRVQDVTNALLARLHVNVFKDGVARETAQAVSEHVLPQLLLEAIQFEAFEVHVGALPLLLILELVLLNQLFEFDLQLIGLVYLTKFLYMFKLERMRTGEHVVSRLVFFTCFSKINLDLAWLSGILHLLVNVPK